MVEISDNAKEEIKKFLRTFQELMENPEFLRGVEAAGYKINFSEVIRMFCDVSGWNWKGPIVVSASRILGAPYDMKPGKTYTADHSNCPDRGVCLADPVGVIHKTVVLAEISAQEEDPHHLIEHEHGGEA